MNYSVDNIIVFLKDLSGNDSVKANTDIFLDIKITGDDFHEMIDQYAIQFSVNMDSYI